MPNETVPIKTDFKAWLIKEETPLKGKKWNGIFICYVRLFFKFY